MFTTNRPTSPNKLRLSHSLLSFSTISLSLAYLYHYNDLENVGHLFQSPIVWMLIAGEIIRPLANKNIHQLEVYLKDGIKTKGSLGYRILSTTVQSIILLTTTTFLYALVCILFGAPLISQFEQTFTLSIMLSTLTVLPLCLYIGPYQTVQFLFSDTFKLTTKSEMAYLQFIRENAIGTILGAWFGSIVVPLDWDQYWQRYPIPNVVGAIIGFTAANGYTIANVFFQEFSNALAKTKRV